MGQRAGKSTAQAAEAAAVAQSGGNAVLAMPSDKRADHTCDLLASMGGTKIDGRVYRFGHGGTVKVIVGRPVIVTTPTAPGTR
jgi:nitrogenase subunit NifH